MSASTGSVAVKQERHDEAEINEMAAKIVEAHKQQSAKAAAAAVQIPVARPAAVGATVGANGVVAPGQANILNYLTRKPTSTVVGPAGGAIMSTAGLPGATTALPLGSGQGGGGASNGASGKAYDGGGSSGTDSNGNMNGNGEKKANDEESQKGHFGWEVFPGKVHIPFILRQQERYCAVRMVEMKLLNKYLTVLHQDIYTCTCVRSYYITEAECKLLNEINTKHCDLHFGREMFTLKDLVVRLSDAYKFHQFLDVCYKKLTVGCGPTSDKCGFIRINKESVVPYTVRDGQKMVPLFYFEGETDNLKLKADNLSGWDLSYLKFCCKVQGIRNELFASDSVAVISLTDIKGYFPPGTEFEDYWPSKVVDSQLLCGPKPNNTVHWTRQPVQPPPKAPAMINNNTNVAATPRKVAANNVYQALQSQQNIAKTSNQMNSITAAVQALTNNWNIVNSNHTNLLSAQQEQLLRLSQAQQAAQAQAQIRNMQSMHSMQQYNSYLNNMSLTSRTSQNQPVPPPLVRSAQVQAAHLSNGGGVPSSSRANSSGSNSLPHLNPALSIFATSSSPNGTVNKSRLNPQQISELAQSGQLGAGGSSGKGNSVARPSAASSGSGQQHGTGSFDGLSLGRNVTITPTGGRTGGGGGKGMEASGGGSFGGGGMSYYGGIGPTSSSSVSGNGNKHPIAYPKNPISITAVPVGSPTRASPKGVQARQPPPALIPVGGDALDGLMGNTELLTQLLFSQEIQIINEHLMESSRNTNKHGSGSNSNSNSNRPPSSTVSSLPSYLESTTNITGSAGSTVIMQDNSRASSRVDFGRNQSVITTGSSRHAGGSGSGSGGGGGLNVLAGSDMGRFRSVLAAAGLSDVIDLSSPPRSNMAGATLNHQQQQQVAAQHQAAAQYQQQQQQHQQSQSSKRSASGSSNMSSGRSNSIISSSSGGSSDGVLGGSNSYRTPGAAVLQQLQQQQQQQQQQAQQQHAAAAAAAVAAAAAAAAVNLTDNSRNSNLILIPELNVGVTQYKPYEVKKKPIENKIVYCVNKSPYRDTEYLMTLLDMKEVFFPYISLDVCRRVLNALEINLFIGNSLQYRALQEAGRTTVDKMPLVQVAEVVTLMPQLQYMVRSQVQDTPANKRARIS